MKTKQLKFIGYFLVIGLIAALTLGATACSSKTSSSTTITTATTSTPTLSSIAVAPASPASLIVGSTQQFTATGTYLDGSTADLSSDVTWTSDSTPIATIDDFGLASGVTVGTANITASLNGVTSPSVPLTVTTATSATSTTPTTTSGVTLSSIAVIPNSPLSLAIGSSLHFKATGTYSDGSTADITSQVNWTSDNTAIATIDSTGLVTGVAPGTANITATLSGVTSQAVSLPVSSP